MEYVNCNLCGCNRAKRVYVVPRIVEGTGRKFNVVRCEECGLVYTNPRLTRAEIKQCYPEDAYYSYHQPIPYNEGYGRTHALRARLKTLVLEECYGWRLARSKRRRLLGVMSERVTGVARKTLAYLLKNELEHGIPFKPRGRILDVGCGNGVFLEWLHSVSEELELYGLEISEKACESLSRRPYISTACGDLLEVRFPDNFFDIVTMWDVLEHLHDPLASIRETARVLNDGGVSCIGLPNFDSIERKIFGEHWYGLQPEQHLYHFTPTTLRYTLEKGGFSVIAMSRLRGSGRARLTTSLLKRSVQNDASRLGAQVRARLLHMCSYILDTFCYGGHIRIIAKQYHSKSHGPS